MKFKNEIKTYLYLFNLKVRTHFGRPNWTNIFSNLVQRHRGERIGKIIKAKSDFPSSLNEIFVDCGNAASSPSPPPTPPRKKTVGDFYFYIVHKNYLQRRWFDSKQGFSTVVHRHWQENWKGSAPSSPPKPLLDLYSTRRIIRLTLFFKYTQLHRFRRWKWHNSQKIN